ncbi:hypothetical protein HCUR_01384 [Holospora curviuscula]|uniref:Uncharacterized protein n=2 Tax=Holospora curviuscula TaxID=1082868 RepID=A0A2S5R797_9PROT|nr:hypothetical protein HCUR_01384 [Holospora curviuscula]
MLYFSWIGYKEEPFSSHHYGKCDIPILFLSLKQTEEKPAVLILHIPLEEEVKSYGVLSWKPTGSKEPLCLFKGYVEKIEQENGVVVIYLNAIQNESSWLRIAQTLRSQKSFCNYFFDEEDIRPESVLADQPLIPYWCPVSGVCTLSHLTTSLDMFHGKEEAQVIQYRQVPGIRNVNISVKAQWIQQVQGMVDVFPWIERAFPHRVLATYTPSGLKKIWPKAGMLLGNSGYRVMHSELVINERKSEFLKLLNSQRIVQRCVFDGSLWLFWNFKQKRKETIQTAWNSQIPGASIDLNWNLGAITCAQAVDGWSPTRAYKKGECVRFGQKIFECLCDHHAFVFQENAHWKVHSEYTQELFLTLQSSFFLTRHGKKAFEFALQRAYVLWLKAARCCHMEIKGSLDALGGVTLGHQYRVSYPKGKIFSGKVTYYEYIANQEGVSVSIGLSALHPHAFMASPMFSGPHQTLGSYAENYAQEWYHLQGGREGRKGAEYIAYTDVKPQDTYAYAQFLAGNQLLDRIDVRSTDVDQFHILETSSTDSKQKHFLHPPAIRLHFQKLKGLDALHHTIPVQMLQGLSVVLPL